MRAGLSPQERRTVLVMAAVVIGRYLNRRKRKKAEKTEKAGTS